MVRALAGDSTMTRVVAATAAARLARGAFAGGSGRLLRARLGRGLLGTRLGGRFLALVAFFALALPVCPLAALSLPAAFSALVFALPAAGLASSASAFFFGAVFVVSWRWP